MEKTVQTSKSKVLKLLGYHDDMDPYLKEMMPLLILCKIVSRSPLVINDNGKLIINLFSVNGIYFLITFGLFSYVMTDVYITEDILSNFVLNDFKSLFSGTIVLLTSLFHYSLVITMLTKWEPLISYMEEWAKLNIEYATVMGSKYKFRFERSILILSASLPVFSVLLVSISPLGYYGTYWYHKVLPITIFVYTTSEQIFLFYTCRELMIMASFINTKLRSLIKDKHTTAKEVYALRRLWMRCSRVVRLTGTSNTVQQLLDVSCTAIVYSVGAFATMSCLVSYNPEVPFYLIIVIISWIRLFLFFEAGEVTAHNVGEKIKTTISTAETKSLNEDVAWEMELFILSVSSNYPDLNINGFARISRRAFIELITQATYNIVVLVQIQYQKNT